MDLAPVEFSLVDAGGWIVVVGAVVLSMVRGWLVPGNTVDRLVTAYKERLADKDREIQSWQEAARISDARGDQLARNQDQLLEVGRTTNDLIRAIGAGGR